MKNTPFFTLSGGLRLSILPAVVILSACADEGSDTATREVSFAELEVEKGILEIQFSLDDARSDLASIPTGGVSTYNGVVSFVVADGGAVLGTDLTLLGDMAVTASFAADNDGRIIGTADNFGDSDFDTYSGNLDISAEIMRDALDGNPSILGGISGELTNDATSGVFTLEGTSGNPNAVLSGDFYGTGLQFIGGTITGQLDTPDGAVLIGEGAPTGSGGFLGGL